MNNKFFNFNKNKKQTFKCQASFENMAIVALMLIPMVIIFSYAYATLIDSTNVAEIDSALDALESSIIQVYSLPIGAQKFVTVILPSGIDFNKSYIGSNSSSSGKSILISYKNSQAFRNFRFNISGKLPNSPGKYLFSIYKAGNNIVKIYPAIGFNVGLVGFYNFSNNTNDSSSYSNNAITFNNVNCSIDNKGLINNYCSLSENGYLLIQDKDHIRFSGSDFSILTVLRKRNASNLYSNYYGIVKWKDDSLPNSNEYGIFLSLNGNDNKIVFKIASSSNIFSVSSHEILLNTWYHIVAIKNSSHIALYVDGVLVNSTYIGNVNVNSLNNPITIGTNNLTSAFSEIDIDELMVYSRALNSFEVEELYLRKYR
ncbi:MAG: LamG domain-containing protein [Candidatus Anstonellales archaeon]